MIKMAQVCLDEATQKAVLDVLKSGQIAQGSKVEEFEKAFANYTGTNYAIATNSGTAALHTALIAAGIGNGDEVITTPFSFVATANCCLYVGARPVFADIDEKTFNISPESIESKITPKTSAVIVVHLFGQACEMDEIISICQRHNLVLIEDACQAHGAEYKGRKVGSFGIGCFSFYPTKNMTTGEGGIITTNDKTIERKARQIRNHGEIHKSIYGGLGYNFRMTEIAATIGLGQLENLNSANVKRMKNADILTDGIHKIKGLIPPHVVLKGVHVFHQYTLKITKEYKCSRDELQQRLTARGIDTSIYYPQPIYRQPFYKVLGYQEQQPVAEVISQQVLSLPVHPGLSEKDLAKIIEALEDA